MPLLSTHPARLHVEDHGGQGLPVVFGHSLLLHSAHFEPVIDLLGPRVRPITIDARNHGRSDAVADTFTLEDMANDLRAVLDELRIDRAVVAGLSMGGMVGMRFALRFPERCAGLLLMNTSAHAEGVVKRMRYEGLLLASRFLWPSPWLIGQITQLFIGATNEAERPELVEQCAAWLSAQDVRPLYPAIRAVTHRPSILGALGTLRVPTHVVTGEEDLATPPDEGAAIASAIPGAQLHTIPRCGHLSTIEAPQAVADALSALLDDLDQAA